MEAREAGQLLQLAGSGARLAGWYNDNVQVRAADGSSAVVRTARWLHESDPEPRMYAERSVVAAAVNRAQIRAPFLLYGNARFQVHGYVPGSVLASTYPDDSLVPDFILDELAALPGRLAQVPRSSLRLLGGDRRYNRRSYSSASGFAEQLRRWLDGVYRRSSPTARTVLSMVGVAENPFKHEWPLSQSAPARKLRLCHGDLSRTNCLWDGTVLTILDWELALWADPAWDLAAHVHRFRYAPPQESWQLERSAAALSAETGKDFLRDAQLRCTAAKKSCGPWSLTASGWLRPGASTSRPGSMST